MELEFKDVVGGAEKVNVVNYLITNPPPVDEFYNEGDDYQPNA